MNNCIGTFVEKLVSIHGTRDPFIIAMGHGIKIKFFSHYKEIKGYYANILGNKYIVINSSLDEVTQKLVAAHELGHALFHDDIEIGFIRKNTMLDTALYEREANEFAAELLIDQTELDQALLEGMSLDQVSKMLNVSEELVSYNTKLRELSEK